jgi:hypothetical protein
VAVRLWNIYVTNVDGCAGLKLLHLLTDELKVYSTIDKPTEASFENLALCLAIYFASAVSLDDEEAQPILGQDKCAHLLSFKTGLEQAFAQGDFLDHPTLTGLHALAIYLVYSIFLYYSNSKTKSKVVFRRRFGSTTTAKGSGF